MRPISYQTPELPLNHLGGGAGWRGDDLWQARRGDKPSEWMNCHRLTYKGVYSSNHQELAIRGCEGGSFGDLIHGGTRWQR